MKTKLLVCLIIIFNACFAKAELPSDSIYHLNAEWTNQNNQNLQLSSLSGKKQVFAMIYTHCLHTCPLIVSSMQALQNTLPDEQRADFNFVLISLTPESDTPTIMKQFAKEKDLDEKSWTLLTGSESNVRSLAMALGIKYKSTDDNEVAHSNLFTVVDEQGRIILQEAGTVSAAKAAAEKLLN